MGTHWKTLGAACYRCGDFKAAVTALRMSSAIEDANSDDWLYLAMARWQGGDHEQARRDFDRGLQWLQQNAPDDVKLGRTRVEAEELLHPTSQRP